MSVISNFLASGSHSGDFLVTPLTWVSGGSEPSDTTEMAIDGSSTSRVFTYQAPAGKTAIIVSCTFILLHPGMDNDRKFGDLATLSNGCSFDVLDSDGSTVVLNLLGEGLSIKRNAHFARFPGAYWPLLANNNGVSSTLHQDGLIVKWDLSTFHGLSLLSEQSFRFIVNDDLSALTSFRCMLRGVVLTNV